MAPHLRTKRRASSGSNDIFIAMMGMTGSGKSTFIQHCTSQSVKVGHSLQACTQKVEMFTCKYSDSVNVQLVDTPGFDDTNRTDTEVLDEIAKWLTATYRNNIKLRGIIYLHRISDPRMPGAARRNLMMFTKLCGTNACPQIVLATTMWEGTQMEDGIRREKELRDTEDFWGYMLSKGSRMERHANDRASAMRLITSVVERGKSSEVALDLQKQMVDEEKTLIETTAGIELEGELLRTKQKFQKEIDRLQKDYKEAHKMQEKEMAKELETQKKEMMNQLRRNEQEQANLQKNSQREHNRRFTELQAELKAARADADAREARQQRLLKDQQESQRKQEVKQKQEIEVMRRQLEGSQLTLPETKRTQVTPAVTSADAKKNQRRGIRAALVDDLNRLLGGADDAKEARQQRLLKDQQESQRKQKVKQKQEIEDMRRQLESSQLTLPETTRAQVTPPVTPAVAKKTDSPISLSMVNSDHYFIGASFVCQSVGSDFRQQQDQEGFDYTTNSHNHVALGVNGSWYRSFYSQITKTNKRQWSANFAIEYPSLYTYLEQDSQLQRPKCLSLGTNGTYFAMFESGGWHAVPADVKQYIGDFSKVRCMWFGMHGAWLAVAYDGKHWWDFKGGYKELDDSIRVHGAPKAVAMNLTDLDEYIAVWDNGCGWRSSGKGVASNQFKEFDTKNGYNQQASGRNAGQSQVSVTVNGNTVYDSKFSNAN